MQPDWKGVCPDTIAQAQTVAGKDYVVLVADMYGVGYGAKPKTYQDLMAGMKAVHTDLPFTVGCGGAGYDALLAQASKLGLVDSGRLSAPEAAIVWDIRLPSALLERRPDEAAAALRAIRGSSTSALTASGRA